MIIKKPILVIFACLSTVLFCNENIICGLASSGAGANLQEIIEDKDNSGQADESGATNSDDALDSSPSNMKNLPESLSCSFVVPEDFHPGDEPGLYVNEFYPLESANITYSVSEIPQDKVLTNAQKAAGESADAANVEFRYDQLTGEMYESIQKGNYEALYGSNIGFTLESFENKDFDGFPGYLIRSSFTPEGSQTIHQVSAIVLSANKIYTIVYSRAEDDDFQVFIEQSIESIHVVGK